VGESLMQDYLGRRYTEKSYCLHCLADNSRAHRFFQRWGFEPWGEAKGGFLAMVRAMD
jgi:RimJ/RimL family protein N-acetyltransferase